MSQNLLAARHICSGFYRHAEDEELEIQRQGKIWSSSGQGRGVLRGALAETMPSANHRVETKMLDQSGDVEDDQNAPIRKKRAALPLVPAPRPISKFPLLPIGVTDFDLPHEGWC